jgi:hypothetical protein
MTTVVSAGLAIWLVLIAAVLLLALFRMAMARGKYTVLHVRRSELSLIPQQVLQSNRLTRIDFWGQFLTALAFAIGLVLVVLYAYLALTEASFQA